MRVTFETLAAIYRLADRLTNADGQMKDEEINTMVDFFAAFGLEQDTFKEIVDYGSNKMGDREAINLLSQMDAEGKQKVANLYARIICSDQELTEEEKGLYFQIRDYCGFPDPQSEDEEEDAAAPEAEGPQAPPAPAPEPEAEPEPEEDENDDIIPAFLIASYQGIVSVKQCEFEDWSRLGPEIASWINANTVEVVRFTPALNALTESLNLNERHLVFMLPRSTDATVGDNMTATILLGRGYELYGDIVFALETDKGYEIEGFCTRSLLNDVFEKVNDAVDGLLRVQ